MTANDRFDTTLGAWLDEGPMDLPDVTRRAILTSLPVTHQARRGLLAPGRFFPMPTLYRAVALVAILVVAAGGAALLLGRLGQPDVAAPVATPTASPSPTPSASVALGCCTIVGNTPSPLDGHTPTFVVPFSYRLPAGEGLVVDDGDPTWYQFRHPNPNGQGYDNTFVIRAPAPRRRSGLLRLLRDGPDDAPQQCRAYDDRRSPGPQRDRGLHRGDHSLSRCLALG
jgi:hypothetical protein